MALIFPQIARYSIVGSYGEQEIVNVFDIDIDTGGVGDASREEALFSIAGDLVDNWIDHVMPLMHANYQVDEVRWVDLNSASGSTGSRTSTDDNDLPVFATGSGQGMPGNVYIKVVKTLDGKTRQQRNGMTRLSAVRETTTTDGNVNRIIPEHVLALNTAFEAFKDGINGAGIDWTANLGVLHTVNQTATGFSIISAFSAQTGLGTIWRRMPGYGV